MTRSGETGRIRGRENRDAAQGVKPGHQAQEFMKELIQERLTKQVRAARDELFRRRRVACGMTNTQSHDGPK